MQVLAAAILAVLEFLATNRGNNAPEDVAQLARQHKDVTLLFMDIVGFTSMAKEVAPETVMVFLNTLFGVFDLLVDVHGVMKVETAGDCYIVAGGILSFDLLEHHDPADSAARVMAFAKDMMASSKQVKMPHNDEPVCIRIGLHTGDCVSGLIGTKAPKYAVFGDTMNTASRMESTCTPGRIQVSAVTHALLPHEAWEATGGVLAKGKVRHSSWCDPLMLHCTVAACHIGQSSCALPMCCSAGYPLCSIILFALPCPLCSSCPAHP
ncbi:nucleotide cyclase [Haematococcus lacustris]